MVKAITFFDLDGTLLNAKTQLDQDVIDAMHQLQKMTCYQSFQVGETYLKRGQL